jgi:hypothetical protein
MTRISRKCTRCGSYDSRDSWSSAEEATKQGVFQREWTCATCAWTVFELEDREQATPREPATRR